MFLDHIPKCKRITHCFSFFLIALTALASRVNYFDMFIM